MARPRDARRNALILGVVLAVCATGAGLLVLWIRAAYADRAAGEYDGLEGLHPPAAAPADGGG